MNNNKKKLVLCKCGLRPTLVNRISVGYMIECSCGNRTEFFDKPLQANKAWERGQSHKLNGHALK